MTFFSQGAPCGHSPACICTSTQLRGKVIQKIQRCQFSDTFEGPGCNWWSRSWRLKSRLQLCACWSNLGQDIEPLIAPNGAGIVLHCSSQQLESVNEWTRDQCKDFELQWRCCKMLCKSIYHVSLFSVYCLDVFVQKFSNIAHFCQKPHH